MRGKVFLIIAVSIAFVGLTAAVKAQEKVAGAYGQGPEVFLFSYG